MNRFVIATLLFLLPVFNGQATDTQPVSVNITKRAPVETLSESGDVTGVTESTVGTKMNLVRTDGTSVILADSQGVHHRIAIAATDYTPPVVAAPTVTNAAPLQPIPTANQASTPPPPNRSPSIASAPDATTSLPDSPITTVKIGDRTTANEMSVWPDGGLADRPLLIAAHGNGGSGPREINGWLKFAKQHHFTIVCPSFLSSVNDGHLAEDEPYFADCIKWIKDNLKYNTDEVFMTGFSGGGFPTWYLATKRPDFFHGFITESGNFAGGYYDLDLSRWFNRPIKLIWGSQDLADISVQNQNAVDALKSIDCKTYTTEIVPGGHHQEHPDLVVAWMEQNLAPDASN
jgi:dienelactone hydrolase